MSNLTKKRIQQLKQEHEEFITSEPLGFALRAMITTIQDIYLVWTYNNLDQIRHEIAINPDFVFKDVRTTDVDDISELNEPALNFDLDNVSFAAGIRVIKEGYNQYTFEVFTLDENSKVSSVQAIENLTLSDIQWLVQALAYGYNAFYAETEEEVEEMNKSVRSGTYGIQLIDVLFSGYPNTYKRKRLV